ncbi:Microtubule-associated protein TORTIFOLIA1 [Camellia lanceoleosa]|uniref:Microtubule-associated protein TORTIFOLIA1 n=1 Tax=Camellia lanceoleosa TaxID=1840588 RepID=A0ACC0IAY4_9ERIC|nr:Microtubule-associated protein TORTIFOLIA1 [Camellia lanceoleosa]
MGGSHNDMVTLENRVRGLERVVEDMTRDLSISSGRRGSNFMMGFEGSSNRPLGKYNSFPDYSSTKWRRSGDGWTPFAKRYTASDSLLSAMRGRGPPWRSDVPDTWDFTRMEKMDRWPLGKSWVVVWWMVDSLSQTMRVTKLVA